MRLPPECHRQIPWRIHAIAADFDLLEVYALPAHGTAEDFERLLKVFAGSGTTTPDSVVVKALLALRQRLGRWLRLDGESDPTRCLTLRARLPDDLAHGPAGPSLDAMRLSSLYRHDNEWAAEASNNAVHAVLHVGWVHTGGDQYRGQLAVLVKTTSPSGRLYLAAIAPFRRIVIYPFITRTIRRRWNTDTGGTDQP